MTWEEVREHFPQRWVVVEAFGAYTEKGLRVIPQFEVVGAFADDPKPAYEHYMRLHHAAPDREYYFLHTSRDVLNIRVMDMFRRKLPTE